MTPALRRQLELGEFVASHLKPRCTLQEAGALVGVSHRRASVIERLALAKLAHAVFEQFGWDEEKISGVLNRKVQGTKHKKYTR